jgi:hypothetical protein
LKNLLILVWIKDLTSIFLFSLLFSTILFAQSAPKIVPGTTEAMQHPGFWISNIKDDPDRVIMTSEQIRKLNEKNQKRPFETTDINGNPYSFRDVIDRKDIIGVQFKFENPLTIKSFPGDSLRARLNRHRKYLESRKFWDRRQLEYNDEMKAELIEKTDFNSIPDIIIPRYGVLVAHTLNRAFPTNFPGWNSKGGRSDIFQSTSLDFNTPVAILHTSKDKDWYYVRSELAFGWIPAAHVAEETAGKIEKMLEMKDFIVSTCHKVPVYADKEFKTFLVDFYLGSGLRLRKKSDDGYSVMVPFREPDGSLAYVPGWIKPDANVSMGFQPFTQRNIINTIFSLLYRRYGWADSFNERDCCGTVRAVYKTFGFLLPRWTTHQLHCTDHVHAFPRKTPNEVKHAIVEKCEPAITFVGHAGHISMYIGSVDNKYYVIHQSGYSYKTDDGAQLFVQRVNVNDTELQGGSNVNTWTEVSEFKP